MAGKVVRDKKLEEYEYENYYFFGDRTTAALSL